MPNPAQPAERAASGLGGVSTRVASSWEAALAAFDDWQRARGMREKTRRAYGVDLAQLAEWATGRGLEPAKLGHPSGLWVPLGPPVARKFSTTAASPFG